MITYGSLYLIEKVIYLVVSVFLWANLDGIDSMICIISSVVISIKKINESL